MAREEKLADEGGEANEQRDKRAARSLRPADESAGFERRLDVRSESVASTGAPATASDLERHAGLLRKLCLLPRFVVEVIRTPFATQTIVHWFPNQKEPNKAPEPTLGAVTPHADACVAPAPIVAHL